jgi:glutamate dehydrogenase/leucine dehydrogenase
VVVQGFGAVGKNAARFLAQKGAVLVGASDTGGTLADPSGLDVGALIVLKDARRPLHDHSRGAKLDVDAVLDIDCDIWIPAARPDVVHAGNVGRLKTRLMPQGANIPCTPEAETALHARGVLVVPDFIANAGGVICAATEYRGGTEREAFDHIADRIRANTRLVLEASRRDANVPRVAALALAVDRVRAAMQTRRWR